MATEGGGSEPSLIDALRAAPERFDLVEAVRILERAGALAQEAARGAAVGPVGGDTDPRTEALRLRAATDLAFPASEVTALEERGARPTLDVTVMGLNGPSAVLPAYYSEMVLAAERARNPAVRAFLDIFNHRAISLFVRAAEKYRISRGFERSGGGADEPFTNAIFALIGLGEAPLRGRLAVADMAVAYYAGHFAHRPPTSNALSRILSDHFGHTVRVMQFQGRWAALAPHEQTCLSASLGLGGYGRLGVDAVCGSKVLDIQSSFRIVLGPLDYDQFMAFLPGTPLIRELVALTRLYVGPTYAFDVQLVLKADQIPPFCLSGGPGAGNRLGWNTWHPVSQSRDDPRDAVFDESVA